MAKNITGLGSTLFSATRAAILRLLLMHPEESYYLNQVIALTGKGVGTVQRELGLLSRCGIILREQKGKQVFFRANPECPVLVELTSIVRKTVGLAEPIRDRLEPIMERCQVAFIYGSLAGGREDVKSDVDLMVIGDVTFAQVCDALGNVQLELAREVNPSVYSIAEFSGKAHLPFFQSVLNGDKIFLKGGEIELRAVASEQLAGDA